MSRSIRKGPYLDEKLVKKVEKAEREGSHQPIKTWARACTIMPEFVGHNFSIHNGKSFVNIFVTEAMVGHKLGEFAHTRTFRSHAH